MNVCKDGCKCSVKISNLSVKKGEYTILKDVSLNVNHGEILALVGKNGSGKTTLLKAVMGRMNYTGSINFFDSKGKKIQRPRIGYVPQTLIFDKSIPLTVKDLFCANTSNLPVWFGHSKKRVNHALDILKKVDADRYINKAIGNLSGGELQRVLLALALDPMPDILLLDEPVSAVDRTGISLFYDLVSSMRSEYHMPIILVSHDLGHVKRYATSLALIDHTVKAIGDAREMMKNPLIKETFGLDLDGGVI